MTLEKFCSLNVGDQVIIKQNMRDEEFLEAYDGRALGMPDGKEALAGQSATVTQVAKFDDRYDLNYVMLDVQPHGMWFRFEIELPQLDEIEDGEISYDFARFFDDDM